MTSYKDANNPQKGDVEEEKGRKQSNRLVRGDEEGMREANKKKKERKRNNTRDGELPAWTTNAKKREQTREPRRPFSLL